MTYLEKLAKTRDFANSMLHDITIVGGIPDEVVVRDLFEEFERMTMLFYTGIQCFPIADENSNMAKSVSYTANGVMMKNLYASILFITSHVALLWKNMQNEDKPDIFQYAHDIFKERNALRGDVWRTLGVAGCVTEIHAKVGRIRAYHELGDINDRLDPYVDALVDCLNYCIFALILIDDKQFLPLGHIRNAGVNVDFVIDMMG